MWRRWAIGLALGVMPAGAYATGRMGGADEVRADVRLLASPELGGRGALTAGLDQAARFIAARFAAVGLLPAGDRGTFFQEVDLPVPEHPSAATRLSLGDERLVLGVDFVPNAGSPATGAGGPLAFVGYGSTRGGFAGVDVRGKVILCLRSAAVAPARLLENAVAHGAVGVLFVDSTSPREAPAALEPLPAFMVDEVSAIASFHVRAAAIDRLLAPVTVAELRAALDVGRSPSGDRDLPRILTLPGWATFGVAWAPLNVKGHNVIGLLPGADPIVGGEAVVVGAHYDHLGGGDEGGALDGRRIHPGADDNASGTAAMLVAAAAWARASPRPRRSILFVAFTGEEKGWAGSRALVARAPKTVVAMLNLDMVGRMKGDALEVNGSTTSPEWRGIVEAANVNLAAADRLTLTFPRGVPAGSDHQPFIMKRVPALFFFTGLHCDYHRGSDTWDKVNAEGVLKVERLALGVARLVADRARRLAFDPPVWADRHPPMECAP